MLLLLMYLLEKQKRRQIKMKILKTLFFALLFNVFTPLYATADQDQEVLGGRQAICGSYEKIQSFLAEHGFTLLAAGDFPPTDVFYNPDHMVEAIHYNEKSKQIAGVEINLNKQKACINYIANKAIIAR